MCEVVYNTPCNTIGVGDPVPYGMNSLGSGDRFDLGPKRKIKIKRKAKSFSQYNYNPAKSTFGKPFVKSAFPKSFGIKQLPLIVKSKKK